MRLQSYAVRRVAAAVAAGLVTLVAGDYASSVTGARGAEAEASSASRAPADSAGTAPVLDHSQATPSPSRSSARR